MCAQSYLLFGKVGKDADYFEVVDYFKDNGIQNQRVLLPQNLRGRDQFEAYLARHLGLSVMSSCNREKCPEYLIKPKGNNQTPGRYTVLVADLSSFEVWSRGGKPNG